MHVYTKSKWAMQGEGRGLRENSSSDGENIPDVEALM